jgi:chromate transporter
MARLSSIFFIFLKIGALTFGGGLAMIPIIKREIISRDWISDEELNDYIAVAQVAPGMIAINLAVLIGQHIRGRIGSLIAVLGVALPSLVIIMVVASLLKEFSSVSYVQYAIKGILVVVVILLVSASIDLGKKAIRNFGLLIYALVAFVLVYFFDVSSMLIILSSFVLGTVHAWLVYRKRADL